MTTPVNPPQKFGEVEVLSIQSRWKSMSPSELVRARDDLAFVVADPESRDTTYLKVAEETLIDVEAKVQENEADFGPTPDRA